MGKAMHGSTHGMAKLKEEQVLIIREQFSKGEKNMVQLACENGVSEHAIYKIVKRLRWKHI